MIQLDPMNILFSYFTSQCIFHGKTHPSFKKNKKKKKFE